MARRKAPDERRRTNTPDATPPPEPAKKPPPPHPAKGRLLKVVVDAWNAYWDSDLAQLVMPSDLPALRRLFGMYDMRERMDRALREQPFVLGSTGQIVAHPASKEAASLDGRILQLEDRFGITPMGRLKLGVTFGAAARSLEELNRDFEGSTDEEAGAQEEADPRLRIIDTTATG